MYIYNIKIDIKEQKAWIGLSDANELMNHCNSNFQILILFTASFYNLDLDYLAETETETETKTEILA